MKRRNKERGSKQCKRDEGEEDEVNCKECAKQERLRLKEKTKKLIVGKNSKHERLKRRRRRVEEVK